MIKFVKNIVVVNLFISLSIASLVHAEENIEIPRNGNYSMSYYDEDSEMPMSLYEYRAQLQDYIENDLFRISSQTEKEISTKKLLEEEVKDIGARIGTLINSISETNPNNESIDYLLSEEPWSDIVGKLKGLRVAADVLHDSGYPDLESLIISGLTEIQNLKMFKDDGSLCENVLDDECTLSRPIYLVELIEKMKNVEAKSKALNIIEEFSRYEALPENPVVSLSPSDNPVKHNKNSQTTSLFCGIIKSHKVRKAIRNGTWYVSSGKQDPSHSCRTVRLYLTNGNGSKNDVQLDLNKESYVEDLSGIRIKIGPAELKMIQEAIN